MRIAMISAVYHATPPTGYGGIERVVHRLTEQLVREGHEVTLFGTLGSHCSGHTIQVDAYDPAKSPSGIRRGADILSEEPLYQAMDEFLKKNPVDVIHDWSFQNLYVLRHPEKFPFVISTCVPPAAGYHRPNLVACSLAHAKLCGPATKFVHYGLELDKWKFSAKATGPFIHISKITKYKGQHLAIEAARQAGRELVIAGNIEDRWYFWTQIQPRLWLNRNARFIGEIDGTQRHLQNAAALIQTPLWFDAFPLVVVESLACGTPVIAFGEGGIPEQIEPGVNGFLCRDVNGLAQAMQQVDQISRENCRAYAVKHFSIERMAGDYRELYQQAMAGKKW